MSKISVAKEIRKNSKAQENNCYICNYDIVETHHIIKVSILTGIVLKFDAIVNNLIIPVIALCPKHHVKMHCLMNDRNGNTTTTEYEKEKYTEIVNMAQYDNNTEYSESYNRSVDRMKDAVLENLE